jgi:hypothetical protein
VNGDPTQIDCSVGSLDSQPKTFTVTFAAPTIGTSIRLDWQAVFDLGAPPGNSNGNVGYNDIGLAPRDDSSVVSAVPGDNLQLVVFTGGGVATPVDSWVTQVKVPGSTTATTAEIAENLAADLTTCAQAGDLTTCNTSSISIPNVTFGTPGTRPLTQFLEITLIRDASTISKSAKISSAVVYYRKNSTDPLGTPVRSCASDPTLPKPGEPCEDLTQRKEFPKRNTGRTPVAPGFESDWKFVIYANDNGRYDQ